MSEQDQSNKPLLNSRPPRFNFTIGSMLILTTVFAASALSLGYYVKAMSTDEPTTEIGTFAIVAAMTPTVFLVMASWFLKVVGFLSKLMK